MSEFTFALIPVGLIVLLVIWSLLRKEKWLMPALVGLSLSSVALVFMFVREQSPHYENFNVGYVIGMYASVVATIPLAAFGWFLGKKCKTTISILIAIAGLSCNFMAAYAYQAMIRKNAETLSKAIVFDCAKVPYHCAIKENRLEAIPELRKKGMDIEAHDQLSRTALWYAINNEQAVKVLLDNGANPDGFNMKNETPLVYALAVGMKPNLPVARLLVSHGAKVNRTFGFRKNISILNFAIVNKNYDVVNFLLENGADPNFVDGYKKSACDRLAKVQKELITNLKKYCPNL